MDIHEGLCYRINNRAGSFKDCGDHSTTKDRGKKVKALLCFDKLDVVQVLDLADSRSRFNVKKGCLDPL